MAPPQLSASQYSKLRKSSEAGLFVVAAREARPRVFGEDTAAVLGTVFALFPEASGCANGGSDDSFFKFEVSNL